MLCDVHVVITAARSAPRCGIAYTSLQQMYGVLALMLRCMWHSPGPREAVARWCCQAGLSTLKEDAVTSSGEHNAQKHLCRRLTCVCHVSLHALKPPGPMVMEQLPRARHKGFTHHTAIHEADGVGTATSVHFLLAPVATPHM